MTKKAKLATEARNRRRNQRLRDLQQIATLARRTTAYCGNPDISTGDKLRAINELDAALDAARIPQHIWLYA